MRLAWQIDERPSGQLVFTDSLAVYAPLLRAVVGEQVVLRALADGGVRWELVRPNVDRVLLAPRALGGRILVALIMKDRSARVLDLDTRGNVLIERRTFGAAPLLIDTLRFDYAVMEASEADDRFLFGWCSTSPRVYCGSAGVEDFLWSSAACASGRTRSVATVTLPTARRKPGNPGFAALDMNDGAIVWEADRMTFGLGCIPTGELCLEPARKDAPAHVGLLAFPEGRMAWTRAIEGTRPLHYVANAAIYFVTQLSPTWLLTGIDWDGEVRTRVVLSWATVRTRILAVDHEMVVWHETGGPSEIVLSRLEDPSSITWRSPSAMQIDRLQLGPDGSLHVVSDRRLVCFRSG